MSLQDYFCFGSRVRVIFLSVFLGLVSVGRTPPARVFAFPNVSKEVFKKKSYYILKKIRFL